VSLRARLLLVALATLAVGLGALLVVGNVVLASRVRSEQSDLLRGRAAALISSLEVTATAVVVRETANDSTNDRLSWVFDGDRVIERPRGVSASLDRAAVALGRRGVVAERDDAPTDVRLRAQPVRARGSNTRVGAVVVGASVEPFERIQRAVLVGSLVVAALILVAGWLAIRSAIDGALYPVAQMTAAAADWGAHDLDRRFGLGPARDELTGLAGTLDGLLARIAASRRHEQRFASEMAHELRTPIAALRARAELAADGTPEERQDALRAVVAQAARLDGVIQTLLAVARGELGPHTGEVDLLAIADEFEGVTVEAPGSLPPAEGSPDVVRRALAPLVENARRHARSQVTLELSAAAGRVRVAVRDDGPGLDPGLGDRAFEPGTRGPRETLPGAGLGLPLARRLARSCGGDIIIGAGPGGCFVLDLPQVDAPAASGT
jgi:signal transduction histidine kinase